MQGRTYQRKVDDGPLVAYPFANLLEFWRFSGFQILRERELILLLKRRALILLLPLLIMHWIAERSRRKALKRKASLRFVRFRATATNQKQSRFESTANYSSQQGQNAELCTALEESCAGDTSTARDRDLCLLRIVVV